ncbi:MAG: hypothetical protein ABIG64_06810 [Candidatus Omnitrophota bacterium]
MKIYKLIIKLKIIAFLISFGFLFFFISNIKLAKGAEDNINEDYKCPKHSYQSSGWNTTMNKPEEKKDIYPDKKKITPETVRLTLNEYYVPQVSELLVKGVDCIEWLNRLDDPYLNRYKLDLRVDPGDDRLKLFWKKQF